MFFLREADLEAGHAVAIGAEGEGAAVTGENLLDEDQTDALSVGFGGEEGGEEFGFCLLVDTASVVGDLEHGG